jgi:hypothetical protein
MKRIDIADLDVVYLSYDEPQKEQFWAKVKNMIPWAIRVDGVKGSDAAHKAAADASETPWFFSVFAKLEIDPTFDFTWQPDRMQQAKHYIFNSRNPVNGLEYGHQGLIAYNKNMV